MHDTGTTAASTVSVACNSGVDRCTCAAWPLRHRISANLALQRMMKSDGSFELEHSCEHASSAWTNRNLVSDHHVHGTSRNAAEEEWKQKNSTKKRWESHNSIIS